MKLILIFAFLLPALSHADGSAFKSKSFGGKTETKYESTFGNKYQYDLSNPVDKLKYDVDLKAQLRDEMDLNPTRELDRELGQYGGGIYKK